MAQFLYDTPRWPTVFALQWDNSASAYYVSAHWGTFEGRCSPSVWGGGSVRHKANCLLTHSYLFNPQCWKLLTTFRALNVYCDWIKSNTPTQEYTAVALFKGDYMYFVMKVWSNTVQALDFYLYVLALAGQLPVSWLGLHMWSALPEWSLTLAEGYSMAKGMPLSMQQVRLWWTGWVEIASGAESVFMSSCQSTDRLVCNVSQAQVWPRHPQSSRLAVPLDYYGHITHYSTKHRANH